MTKTCIEATCTRPATMAAAGNATSGTWYFCDDHMGEALTRDTYGTTYQWAWPLYGTPRVGRAQRHA